MRVPCRAGLWVLRVGLRAGECALLQPGTWVLLAAPLRTDASSAPMAAAQATWPVRDAREQAPWAGLSPCVLSLPHGAEGRDRLHGGFPAAPLPAGTGGTPPCCPRLPSRGRCGRCLGSPEGGGGLCGSVPRDELWRPLCAGGCCWVRADSCQAELACPDRAVARGLSGRCLQSAEQERSVPVPAAPQHRGMTRRRPSSASWKLALGFTVAVPSGRRRCREPHSRPVPARCHVTPEPDSHAHVHRAPLL